MKKCPDRSFRRPEALFVSYFRGCDFFTAPEKRRFPEVYLSVKVETEEIIEVVVVIAVIAVLKIPVGVEDLPGGNFHVRVVLNAAGDELNLVDLAPVVPVQLALGERSPASYTPLSARTAFPKSCFVTVTMSRCRTLRGSNFSRL